MLPSKAVWAEISRHITATTQQDQVIKTRDSVSGGDISQAYVIRGEIVGGMTVAYFVKLNWADTLPMFEAEALALQHMGEFGPATICLGLADDFAYIVLEHMELTATGNEAALGTRVAALHAIAGNKALGYGWQDDNFIGSTPQHNAWLDDWSDFWWRRRILPQLEQAYKKGFRPELEKFSAALKNGTRQCLSRHHPTPVLLHGDLWAGNKAYLTDGRPILFDPASYFGDRETDIAMTELFGGFSEEFYCAYYQEHPRQDGYEQRKTLYNLYHILNHLNLFGGHYLHQATGTIKRIID